MLNLISPFSLVVGVITAPLLIDKLNFNTLIYRVAIKDIKIINYYHFKVLQMPVLTAFSLQTRKLGRKYLEKVIISKQ